PRSCVPCLFYCTLSAHHRPLHSFPTRRSSDLTLPPYGFYWFALTAESEPPAWHTPAPEPMPEYITMVFRHSLTEALASTGSELRSEEHTSELQSLRHLVCRLLLEKKKQKRYPQ